MTGDEKTQDHQAAHRVLVAEDDPGIQKIFRDISGIPEIGYLEFVVEPSGEDALERLETDSKFDLFLTDVCMLPGRYGPDIAMEVRERYGIPYMIMTAGLQTGKAKMSVNTALPGAAHNKLIRKPLNLSELLGIIKTKIEEYRQSQGPGSRDEAKPAGYK